MYINYKLCKYIIYILYKTKTSQTSKGIRVREAAQIVWSNQPGTLYPPRCISFSVWKQLIKIGCSMVSYTAYGVVSRQSDVYSCGLNIFRRALRLAHVLWPFVPWLPCPTSATVLSVTIVNLIGRGERKVSVSQLNDDRTPTPFRKTEIPVRRFRSFRAPLRSVRD